MQKISTPFELEKLANDLKRSDEIDKRARLSYLEAHPELKKNFLQRIFSSPKFASLEEMKSRNDARFVAFPQEVDVTPEIALFIYKTKDEQVQREVDLEKKYNMPATFLDLSLGTPLRLAFLALWPSPDSIASMGQVVKNFANAFAYDRDLKKIIDDRKQLIIPILGNYRLIEKKPGEYCLQLQPITEYQYYESTGRVPIVEIRTQVPNAGIDDKLNPSNLPPLPPVQGRVV